MENTHRPMDERKGAAAWHAWIGREMAGGSISLYHQHYHIGEPFTGTQKELLKYMFAANPTTLRDRHYVTEGSTEHTFIVQYLMNRLEKRVRPARTVSKNGTELTLNPTVTIF